MVFMHSRAMNEPVEFARMETFLQLCEARFHLSVTELEQPHYAMMFRRNVSDQDYGKLIDLRMYSETHHWFLNFEIKPVSAGIVVLEQQERVWSFLRTCAQTIMHDLPGDRIFDALPYMPVPSPPIDHCESSWSEAAELMPYSAPGTINLDRMTRLFRAKRDEQLDHYFYLREDPVYLKDTTALHPRSLEFTLMPARWDQCISSVMWDAFVEQRAWVCLHKISEVLQHMYGKQPSADQFRDVESHQTMKTFFHALREHFQWRLQKLMGSCMTSPWSKFIFATTDDEIYTAGSGIADIERKIAAIIRQVYRLNRVAQLKKRVTEDVKMTIMIAEAQRLQDGNFHAF
jgi:hypothetical protein